VAELCICYVVFFFFSSRRRHTRFSRDWSSDVCSSESRAQNVLAHLYLDAGRLDAAEAAIERARLRGSTAPHFRWEPLYTLALVQIGRASCRERVYTSGAAVSLKKKV